MIIQMIPTSAENSIFITGFDAETQLLTYRLSKEPKQKHIEQVQKDDKDMLHIPGYHFQEGYLNKFINENEII